MQVIRYYILLNKVNSLPFSKYLVHGLLQRIGDQMAVPITACVYMSCWASGGPGVRRLCKGRLRPIGVSNEED